MFDISLVDAFSLATLHGYLHYLIDLHFEPSLDALSLWSDVISSIMILSHRTLCLAGCSDTWCRIMLPAESNLVLVQT